MRTKFLKLIESRWFVGGSAFIIGAFLILAIRFATYQPEDQVHYHANFGVYINGQREKFEGPRYYEETEATSCTLEHVESPAERAHMHGNVSDVVHVEDHLVTWGHFFQNLGWAIGDDYLKSSDKIYSSDEQNKLTFILNGKKVNSVTNLIIEDLDRLIVDFGNTAEQTLQEEFKAVPTTAQKYNVTPDPAGCSGNRPTTITDRFKHLF